MAGIRITQIPIFTAFVAACLAVGCLPSDESDQRRQNAKVELEAKSRAIDVAIAEFAKRTGADITWKTNISYQETVAFRPLYSIDLERVWLADRPILFLGHIEDVATHDEAHYRLLVRDADLLSPELRLQLLCSKQKVTPILESIRSKPTGLLPGGIGVAARITQVGHETEPVKEGSQSVFTGYGRCVDIIHLGDTMDLMFKTADTGQHTP